MHNLSTVFNFEFKRTLKKKSFWIMALAFPVIILAIFAIVYFSNKATNQAALDAQGQTFSFGVTDTGKHIDPQLLAQSSAQTITDKQQGITRVKSGALDAYFYYPSNVSNAPVEVYAKDVGLFDNSRYQAAAEALLQQSVAHTIDKQTFAILQHTVNYQATTYKDGAIVDGFKQVIAPGIFLVLFYILISMFGNQMLTSTTEEKENRVTEMLLTTVAARTLIIGKILAMITLAFIQIVIIILPVVAAYFIAGKHAPIPNIDLTNIPFDPVRLTIGAIIFALSFLLFTGLLVAIGSAMPTAKEANGFFGIVIMLIFGPLYAVTLFVSSPNTPLVTFLSFFPLTAPIPLMLRNAVGNLTIPDALLSIGILAISVAIVFALAIRIFRYGALEYSNRLSLARIFKPNKKSAS